MVPVNGERGPVWSLSIPLPRKIESNHIVVIPLLTVLLGPSGFVGW